MQKKSAGNLGENIALSFLKKNGYRFLDRNFRSHFGEIDLVMLNKHTVVFIEVKTRFSIDFGPPETAIRPYKIRSLIKTAQYFMLCHPQLPNNYRIDVVAIIMDKTTNKPLSINHLKNITQS